MTYKTKIPSEPEKEPKSQSKKVQETSKKEDKKAYISCDDNDMESSDEEEANICLMANHKEI